MKEPPESGAWLWQRDPDAEELTWHEIPYDDLIEHELSRDCLCGPTVFPDEVDGIIVIAHPSLDGREDRFEP